MRIFIFKSSAKSGLRAFAGEAGGQKLPTKLGPWHAVGVDPRGQGAALQRQPRRHRTCDRRPGFQLFKMKSKAAAAS